MLEPSTLRSADTKLITKLLSKVNKYSSKWNDNANTIDAMSEEEKKQQLVTRNPTLEYTTLASNTSPSTMSSSWKFKDGIRIPIRDKLDEINREAILDAHVNTNNNTPTQLISITQLVKTEAPNLLNRMKPKVQILIHESPTTTKSSKIEMKIKHSKTTTKIKEITKQIPVHHKLSKTTTTRTTANAKITQTTKTTTSSTSTETLPTTTPTAFEALKRSILSLFPKNLGINFNIVKIVDDLLKTFNLNSLFNK